MKFNQLPTLATTTLRRNISLQQQQLPDDEDDPATTPSVDFKCTQEPPLQQQQRKRKRKKVHFQDESLNIVHENHQQSRDEVQQNWYTASDLWKFRQDTKAEMLALRAVERLSAANPDSWAKSLLAVYQVFCAAQTVKDIRTLMPVAPLFTLTTHTIGMERRAIPAISRDASERRQQIVAMVLHWQQAPIGNNRSLREEMMREASMIVSRPSRLYAHNVAVISVRTEL